jgi:hypothetical protein
MRLRMDSFAIVRAIASICATAAWAYGSTVIGLLGLPPSNVDQREMKAVRGRGGARRSIVRNRLKPGTRLRR